MGGITVNKLVTTFEFRLGKGIKQYEQTLRRLDKQGERTANNAARAMNRSLGQMATNIQRSYSQLFNGIQRQANSLKLKGAMHIDNSQAKGKIREVSGMVDGLTRRIGSMAMGLTGGIGVGGSMAFVGKAAGEMETAMTRLNTLVGPKFSKGVFAGLQKFAKDTPYELKDVLDMFVQLQGAGFTLMNRQTGALDYKAVETLGDLASASNRGLPELTQAMLSSKRGLPSMMDNFIGMAGKVKHIDGEDYIKATMMDPRTGKEIANQLIKGTDTQSLFEFWLKGGKRDGVAGGMKELAKTLPGQMSTLGDSMKNAAQKFWGSGVGDVIHERMSLLIERIDELEPKAMQLGKTVGKWMGFGFRNAHIWAAKLAPMLPKVAAGVALIATNMLGLKVLSVGSWLSNMMMLLNPMALVVGALTVGVGYLGYEIFKFATTGEGLIADLSKKFPELGDAIDIIGETFNDLMPTLEEIWGDLSEIGEEILKDLGPIALKVFKEDIIPAIKAGAVATRDFVKDWKEGYHILKEDILPNLRNKFESFLGDLTYWAENAKNMFNLLREQLDKIFDIASKLGGMPFIGQAFDWLRKQNNWMGAGEQGQPQGSGPNGKSAGLGPQMDTGIAARLSRVALQVRADRKMCWWAVKQIVHGTVGDYKGSDALVIGGKRYMPGRDAADAGPQLMKMGFRKTQLDPKDPLGSLPDGAVLIWQRGVAGFSAKSGHAEAYDKDTNAFYYGLGPDSASRRNPKNLLLADVYVPTEAGRAPMPVAPKAPASQQPLMQNGMFNGATLPPITQNFYGQQNPAQVKQATKQGVLDIMTITTGKFSPARPGR